MAANWPKTEEAFLKWFWEEKNGNTLVKKLNRVDNVTDRIRREKFAPHIYGIVLNDREFPFKDENGKQWKLCKIGFTHQDTASGTNNRMEQLRAKIQSKYEEKNKSKPTAATLFVVRIGAVDTNPYHSTEERIRKRVGKPVHKEVAKKYGLMCSTEWVLTTQDYIDGIMKKKDDFAGAGDVIDIFKDLREQDTPMPSENHQKEWLHAPAET